MAKLTLNYLAAENQALRAKLDAQQAQINKLFAKLDEQAIALARANMPLTNTRALFERAKQLAQQGIPCYVRGGQIHDAKTHEVLA